MLDTDVKIEIDPNFFYEGRMFRTQCAMTFKVSKSPKFSHAFFDIRNPKLGPSNPKIKRGRRVPPPY